MDNTKKIKELKKQIKIIEQSNMYEFEKISLIYKIKQEIKKMEDK